jgi:ferredoxin
VRRQIIHIDRDKCDGCGLCVPACHEGAIVIENGKAVLAREAYCDGLGACLGECPQGAITLEERDAAPFDQAEVAAARAPRPRLQVVARDAASECDGAGCVGARQLVFSPAASLAPGADRVSQGSALSHWPIQLHLIAPLAPQYRERDLVLAADCVPFAFPDFHRRFLAGNALAIACPKLDHDQEIYADKLGVLVEQAGIKSLTVVTMEVPCCMGLLRLAEQAVLLSNRTVPLVSVVVGVRGEILRRTEISARGSR